MREKPILPWELFSLIVKNLPDTSSLFSVAMSCSKNYLIAISELFSRPYSSETEKAQERLLEYWCQNPKILCRTNLDKDKLTAVLKSYAKKKPTCEIKSKNIYTCLAFLSAFSGKKQDFENNLICLSIITKFDNSFIITVVGEILLILDSKNKYIQNYLKLKGQEIKTNSQDEVFLKYFKNPTKNISNIIDLLSESEIYHILIQTLEIFIKSKISKFEKNSIFFPIKNVMRLFHKLRGVYLDKIFNYLYDGLQHDQESFYEIICFFNLFYSKFTVEQNKLIFDYFLKHPHLFRGEEEDLKKKIKLALANILSHPHEIKIIEKLKELYQFSCLLKDQIYFDISATLLKDYTKLYQHLTKRFGIESLKSEQDEFCYFMVLADLIYSSFPGIIKVISSKLSLNTSKLVIHYYFEYYRDNFDDSLNLSPLYLNIFKTTPTSDKPINVFISNLKRNDQMNFLQNLLSYELPESIIISIMKELMKNSTSLWPIEFSQQQADKYFEEFSEKEMTLPFLQILQYLGSTVSNDLAFKYLNKIIKNEITSDLNINPLILTLLAQLTISQIDELGLQLMKTLEDLEFEYDHIHEEFLSIVLKKLPSDKTQSYYLPTLLKLQKFHHQRHLEIKMLVDICHFLNAKEIDINSYLDFFIQEQPECISVIELCQTWPDKFTSEQINTCYDFLITLQDDSFSMLERNSGVVTALITRFTGQQLIQLYKLFPTLIIPGRYSFDLHSLVALQVPHIELSKLKSLYQAVIYDSEELYPAKLENFDLTKNLIGAIINCIDQMQTIYSGREAKRLRIS